MYITKFSIYALPMIALIVFIIGAKKRINIFDEFIEGAKENLKLAIELTPILITVMLSVGLFRASNIPTYISELLSPTISQLGLSAECLPLALIRPISNSSAMAVYEDILNQYGVDSLIGLTASVMMGASETTFYTLSLYFGTVKFKNMRHTLFCALLGDFTTYIISSIVTAKLF
ncbi:MAG: spore maturation protein [Ruminococcus sp.]|nr:spore maturation protein [Ruminococcus sp.]